MIMFLRSLLFYYLHYLTSWFFIGVESMQFSPLLGWIDFLMCDVFQGNWFADMFSMNINLSFRGLSLELGSTD